MEKSKMEHITLTKYNLVLHIAVLIVGIFLMQFYLLGLNRYDTEIYPTTIFWLGAILVSSVLMHLWYRERRLHILVSVLFVVALSLMYIPTSRFNVMPGTDILGEYQVAEMTRSTNRWPLEYSSTNRFASSLSVTILPAVISHVTGINMFGIFEFILPFLSALVPVVLFLVLRKAYDSKLAAVSAIIFTFNPIYVGLSPQLQRENLATISLLLSLLCLLNKNRRFTFLGLFFALITATFHYTMADFSIFILLIILLSPRLCSLLRDLANKKYFSRLLPKTKIFGTAISPSVFMFAVAVTLFWFVFVSYALLSLHATVVSDVIRVFRGSLIPQQQAYTSYILVSPQGLVHTVVRNFLKLLILGGFLLSLKTAETMKDFALTITGGAMGVMLFLWILVPRLSFALFMDRLYGIGFLFFSTFTALSIIKISSHAHRWKILVGTSLVTMILLESLVLPPIYLHSEQSLNPEDFLSSAYQEERDFTSWTWMAKRIENKSIILSDIARVGLEYFAKSEVPVRLTDLLTSGNFEALSKHRIEYIIASSWLIDQGYIQNISPEGERTIVRLSLDKSEELFSSKFHLVYSNGKNFVFRVKVP